MKVIKNIVDFFNWRAQVKSNGRIGFVPTMGALHKGHAALIQTSLYSNKITCVSLFVNPLQFRPGEDFKKYPRPLKNDMNLLRKLGVDVIFAPSLNTMYPCPTQTTISVDSLSKTLCAHPSRRGKEHFQGVATVVAKLFNIVRPDRAYFGMKDFQQLRIIEQMNQDLNFNIDIVRCPTVRETDGLAISSRNSYLNIKERAIATELYLALQSGAKLLRSNPRMDSGEICRFVKRHLSRFPRIKVDYVELVDGINLKPLRPATRPALLAAAIFLGHTRLIDNILVN